MGKFPTQGRFVWSLSVGAQLCPHGGMTGSREGPAPGSDTGVSDASVSDSQFHGSALAPALNAKCGLRRLY